MRSHDINNSLRLLAVMLVIATWAGQACALELADEDLEYAIMYKWGLVNKQAGAATLSLRSDQKHFRAQLAARTVPWADKIYKVRDTLRSVMSRPDYTPVQYVKISHEGGSYSYNILNYTSNNGILTADVNREVLKKNGQLMKLDTILSAREPGVDMLSVFYYIRLLDFPNMQPGQSQTINVFSGKKVERLTITYNGEQKVSINKTKLPAYSVTFTFTHDGQQSDYPMYTWISQDDQRIPLKLEGQLPLGKVQAYYTGAIPE